MEALFNAKSRVRESTPAPVLNKDEAPAQEKIVEAPVLSNVEVESVSSPEKEAQETQNVPKPEQTPSTTSALLARKKNLRK